MKFFIEHKYHIPILVALSAFLIFWNCNVIPITDGDSAFYLKIAKNMVQTGDFLTPHYGDAGTLIDKPPLMMWVSAVSFKLFGFNDFAANFWHGLFSILVVFFTYKLAVLLYDKRVAFISGLVLITSAQFFYLARSPLQDIPLTLFVLLSVYCYLLYERKKNVPQLYLSAICVALAVLTKGPVGLALPGLIILFHLIINKKKLPPTIHLFGAIAAFLLVAAPWFIFEYKLLGPDFINLFIGHNFGRYLGPIDTIGNEAAKFSGIKPQYDLYSFFLQILILFIPWSGFLYPAFYYQWKKRDENIPVIFSLAVILFFSLSLNYKISRYILPAFPALAMITGKYLHDLIWKHDGLTDKLARISYWITLILVTTPLIVISVSMIKNQFSDISSHIYPIFLPFMAVLIMGLLAGPIAGFLRQYELSFMLFVVLSSFAYMTLVDRLAIHYKYLNPTSRFTEYIDQNAKPGNLVCQYRGTDAHFMIYYSKNEVIFIRDKQKMLSLLSSGKKVYCISQDNEKFEDLKKSLGKRIRTVDKSANFTLFTN